MAKRYFVREADTGNLILETTDVNAALDVADATAKVSQVNATVADDRGRVFGFFGADGSMRDSTMTETV